MSDLFDKHGGFRRLHSFTLATLVQIETLRFCRRFLTFDHKELDSKFYDPKGRQYDQMTQAARSGRQNIIEGSERSATSKDTEMKLTDVARASLSELRGDYENARGRHLCSCRAKGRLNWGGVIGYRMALWLTDAIPEECGELRFRVGPGQSEVKSPETRRRFRSGGDGLPGPASRVRVRCCAQQDRRSLDYLGSLGGRRTFRGPPHVRGNERENDTDSDLLQPKSDEERGLSVRRMTR